MDITALWIPVTVTASAAQTARNAMQRSLTEVLGTVGATQVRFLYGFPFALIMLGIVLAATRESLPRPDVRFLAFAAGGAVAQIAATVLMLAAMRERSFAVAIAYTKTEPVQVALFGLLFLGDPVTPVSAFAIAVATAGVMLTSLTPGTASFSASGLKPALLGVAAGACFAMAAVGFRGAILALPTGTFLARASATVAWALCIQTLILATYMAILDRAAFLGSLRAWPSSLFAGLMGAFASQMWFIGFSLTTAANVRTLGLIEVLFAHAVSRRLFAEGVVRRELIGLVLIIVGVGLLLIG